jgi:hypothetical protein
MDRGRGGPNLTVATSRGPRLAKRVTIDADGNPVVDAHEDALHFTFQPGRVDSLRQLHALLKRLLAERRSMLLADVPDPDVPNPDGFRRSEYFHGEREWLAIDSDNIEVPDGIHPCSPEAAEYVRGLLPDYLRRASCAIQFSGGAGFKGRKVRVRLWFRLNRPIHRDRLKRWAQTVNAKVPGLVDEALFRPHQPHLTADPVLGDGVEDPFIEYERLLPLHRGEYEQVPVDAIEDEIATHEAKTAPAREGAPERASGALAGFLSHARGFTDPEELFRNDALGVHNAVLVTGIETARELGPDAPREKLEAVASRAQRAALRNRERGLLDRDRDYILRETSLVAITRSYRGAVEKGYALRTPDGAATGLDAAIKDARDAAAGKPRVPGYTVQEWVHHAVRRGLARLGPVSPEGLVALVESRTGLEVPRATRDMVRSYWNVQRDTYRRDHRLKSPHYDVQRIGSVEEVEIKIGTFAAVKAPHGSRKTTVIGPKVLGVAHEGGAGVITHRRSLEGSIASRLGTETYRNRGAVQPDSRGVGLWSSKVIDSVGLRKELQEALLFEDSVLIDEAEQVLRHLAGEHTRPRVARLLPVLKNALSDPNKTIVLLDAGLDERTILDWQRLAGGREVRVYEMLVQPRGTLFLHRESGRKNARATTLADAEEALKRGERPVIATDNKKAAQAIDEALTAKGWKGGRITGAARDEETKLAFSAAPDSYPQEQGWQYLVYSPAIAAGVSLESGHFTTVIGLYSGVVSPADFLQMLFRVRTVREYTVAVVAQGILAPVPLQTLWGALERLSGEEIDEVSGLVTRVEEREVRDRQAFGIKFCIAAEDAGLTVERIGGDADLEPLALELREIADSIRARSVTEVLDAPILDPVEVGRLKQRRDRGETLPAAEALALDRAHVCEWVGIEESETLSAEDVQFAQTHKSAKDIIALFALTVALMLEPGRDIPEAFTTDRVATPLVLRRYRLPKARVFAGLLRGLGVDPATGHGIWKLADAAEVLAKVAAEHPDALTAMGLRREKWGARVAETVRSLLARVGLRVRTSGPRRDREYQITPESWRQMITYATRTGVLCLAEGAYFDELPLEYDEDEELDQDNLPDWIRETLRRVGVVIQNRQWLIETLGVSRATATRRCRELTEIAAPGLRRFRVENAERSVEGITKITEVTRLEQVVGRALGAELGWLGWVEDGAGEGAHDGHLRQKRYRVFVSSDQSEPPQIVLPSPPTTETERPAHDPGPVTPTPPSASEEEVFTARELAEAMDLSPAPPERSFTVKGFADNAGLSPAQARRLREKGAKYIKRLLREAPAPALRTWLKPTKVETRALIETAMGAGRGDPLAAQRWIRDHTPRQEAAA